MKGKQGVVLAVSTQQGERVNGKQDCQWEWIKWGKYCVLQGEQEEVFSANEGRKKKNEGDVERRGEGEGGREGGGERKCVGG
jgi:hypothetical protein